MNKKITAYFSHPIRGRAGDKATQKEKDANCKDAILVARLIRKRFPELEIYVPAEMDEFPDVACKQGYLTIDQLLAIDCEIVKRRDILLAYAPNGGYLSNGMKREIDTALDNSLPVVVFDSLGDCPTNFITFLAERAKRKMRE